MTDVIFVMLFLGFMAACAAYVALCERVAESDQTVRAKEVQR